MTPDRIARLEAAYRKDKTRQRAQRRNLHPDMRHFGAVPLNEIGEQLGVSRERVRQLEARALRKLCSTEHRVMVEDRLDEAIVEWHRAKASGSETRMHWAIHNVDVLLDALTWLEELRNGTLRSRLAEAMQRQDEPTVYVGDVNYDTRLMPAPKHGKWMGRMLAKRNAGGTR